MARPKLKSKPRTVGIKELKDRASALVQDVVKSGRPITIAKNGEEVAQIVPLRPDPIQMYLDLGLISKVPTEPWETFKLRPVTETADEAIAAIIRDRDER